MNITISKEANVNYLAKVVQINKLQKHPNADKLQVSIIDFQEVIVGMDTKEGDLCIFMPLESQISSEFLSHTNSYRHSNLNRVVDDEHTGFFEDNSRVRAVRLRGQKSMGVLFPVISLQGLITGIDLEKFFSEHIGEEFDTINDTLLLKKYFIPVKNVPGQKQGKKARISRLVENQFRFHIDTENLRKNMHKINPEDYIGITYKIHGSSFIIANVLVKKKLGVLDRILKKIGVHIKDIEYDLLHASRKVCKNEFETKNKAHFYEYDLWADIKEEIKEFVPKGYSVYGEIAGFTKNNQAIQSTFDYGCASGEHKLFIYRITFTNEDGVVYNLSTLETKEFCDRCGLNYVPLFYWGKAKDLFLDVDPVNHWEEDFMINLENRYTEKDCFLCVNKNPEEGIVIRKESQFGFEAYKLKSFAFLQKETELLDKGEVDMESAN